MTLIGQQKSTNSLTKLIIVRIKINNQQMIKLINPLWSKLKSPTFNNKNGDN